MKTLFVVLTLIVSSFAFAHDDWTTGDTIRETVYQTTNLIDMGTTISIAKNPTYTKEITLTNPQTHSTETYLATYYRYERNPLIGDHPSVNKVVLTMTAGAVAHAAISYVLPRGWRDAWQYVTSGESAWCIHNNFSLGLKVQY